VFLQTVHYPALDDRELIKELREQIYFQCKRVLGRSSRNRQPLSNLLPEPLDYLEVPNDRDTFAVSNPRQLSQYEPILVFEMVHGQPLDVWRREQNPSALRVLRILADLLDFLGTIHAEGMLLNGLAPEAVWVGEDDRLHYMGSERIIDAAKQQKQR